MCKSPAVNHKSKTGACVSNPNSGLFVASCPHPKKDLLERAKRAQNDKKEEIWGQHGHMKKSNIRIEEDEKPTMVKTLRLLKLV